jgi:hypothetical protein
MRFSTDHYFHIGTAHYSSGKPCQDYALSGSNENIACAIVSDGCSTGRHTDVGSRIVTFSTLQAVREHARTESIFSEVKKNQISFMQLAERNLGLEKADMLATCVYAYLSQDGAIVSVQGDGVVSVKYRDGCIMSQRFDWTKNAPFYPSYDEKDAERFIQNLHEGVKENAFMSRTHVLHFGPGPNVEERIERIELIPFDEGRKGFTLHFSKEELSQIDFIAVFTDGVTQVGKANSSDFVPWYDVVSKLMSFKSFNGEFAKRRMIRELKDLSKQEVAPVDDIAYAVVRIEHDEKEESS